MLKKLRQDKAQDRRLGALIGLAVGDALGTALEFKPPGTFVPLTDMLGGGPFNLRPGQWTDDTSMALCLLDSLTQCNGFDAHDQMTRYCRWYDDGYLSSRGFCFDIGNTTRDALDRFRDTDDPFAGSDDEYAAGNGSLMRLAPIPVFYHQDADACVAYAALSSRTTHGEQRAVDACAFYAGLIWAALNGETKDNLLAPGYSPAPDALQLDARHPAIQAVAIGSYKTRQPPEIRGSGFVVDALEAALWAFHHSDTFRDGALLAVNLGDDADTTGAIYGQLAGAYYGYAGIPAEWVERVEAVLEETGAAITIRQGLDSA